MRVDWDNQVRARSTSRKRDSFHDDPRRTRITSRKRESAIHKNYIYMSKMAHIIKKIASFFTMAAIEPMRHYDFSSDRLYSENGPYRIRVVFTTNWTNDDSFITQITNDIDNMYSTPSDVNSKIEFVTLDFSYVAVDVLDLFQIMDKLKYYFKATEFLTLEFGGLVSKKRKRDDSFIESIITNNKVIAPKIKQSVLTFHGVESGQTHPIRFVHMLARFCHHRKAELQVNDPSSYIKQYNRLTYTRDGHGDSVVQIDMHSEYYGIHILDLAMGFDELNISSIFLVFSWDYLLTERRPLRYVDAKFVKKLGLFLGTTQKLESIPKLHLSWRVRGREGGLEAFRKVMKCMIEYESKLLTRPDERKLVVDSEEEMDAELLREVLNCGANNLCIGGRQFGVNSLQAFVNGFQFGENLTKIELQQEKKWQDFLVPAIEASVKRPWELDLAFPEANDVTMFLVKLSEFDSGVKSIEVNHNFLKQADHEPTKNFDDCAIDNILFALKEMTSLETLHYPFNDYRNDVEVGSIDDKLKRTKLIRKYVKWAKYGILSECTWKHNWDFVAGKIFKHIDSESDSFIENFKLNLFFECFSKFDIMECLKWDAMEQKAAMGGWFPPLREDTKVWYC